jgi:hypothetical protein
MLTKEQLDAMRGQMNDQEWLEEQTPETIAWHNYILKNYGDPEKPNTFAKRFDQYYSPFVVGQKGLTRNDVIPPNYRSTSPYDTPRQAEKKFRFNEALNKSSAFDPVVTAGAAGLGMIPMMSGTLPGIAGGMAIKSGVPVLWNLIKQKMASRKAKRKMAKNYYKQISGKM